MREIIYQYLWNAAAVLPDRRAQDGHRRQGQSLLQPRFSPHDHLRLLSGHEFPAQCLLRPFREEESFVRGHCHLHYLPGGDGLDKLVQQLDDVCTGLVHR